LRKINRLAIWLTPHRSGRRDNFDLGVRLYHTDFDFSHVSLFPFRHKLGGFWWWTGLWPVWRAGRPPPEWLSCF
jgi:hypothetical protein